MITRLKIERVKRGHSQLDIALRVGISSGRMSLLERGITAPHDDEAERISALFGVCAGRLFADVQEPIQPAV